MHEFFLSAHIGLIILFVALATEALVEIIKESDISLALIHSKIIPRYEENPSTINWVLFKWITCGQCMSVIYSIPGAIFLSTYLPWYYLPFSFLAFLFVIQRLSNWLNTSYKLLYRGRVTAVELVSPLISVDHNMAYDPTSLLSNALEREFRRGSEERIIIRSVSDIKRIIQKLQNTKPSEGRTVSVNVGGSSFNVNTSTNHPSYLQIIKDAFEGIDVHQSEIKPIPINGEEIIPLNIGPNHAIDNFIRQCTGGERDGNRIKWTLPEGDYFFDPVVGKLTFKESNG